MLTHSIGSKFRRANKLLAHRRIHLSSHKHDGQSHPGSSPSASKEASIEDRKFLRNIGIIAHINAGKTTTTERFLYLAGSTHIAGDVDKGNTVTDYLVQERDRGITITSAVVSFNWLRHRLNLIDTPGHVDFTFEVERSLSVLDGAIMLLDASAGVEAQTITVWNQAKRYHLPNIIFLNKCDKPQADYEMCLEDLKKDLDIDASLIQIPVKMNNSTKSLSIIDVINRSQLTWTNPEDNYGAVFETQPLTDILADDKKKIEHKIEELREKLITKLSDADEELATHVIESARISEVSSDMIQKALCRATKACQISPVLVGSSFRYIGVQPLLDAVVKYLPPPLERPEQVDESLKSDNCAYVFKIMHDKRLGALSYLRVIKGSLQKMQRFKNLADSQPEQVKKVYRVFADELKEISDPVKKDDIVVVTGLNHSRTGSLLVDTHVPIDDQNEDNDGKVSFLGRIQRIEPVYLSSIESRNQSQQIKLEKVLAMLSREDPSFEYDINSLGITTVRGMGKLHLEIIRDRIRTEHGIDALLGPIQISFRETIEGECVEELSVDRLVNSVKNVLQIKLSVSSKPGAGLWRPKQLLLDHSSTTANTLHRLRTDHRRAIENGLRSALQHGPLLGHPVIDCEIMLLDFHANNRCSLPIISSAASQCLTNALRRCSPVLLEPIMHLEVVTPQEHNGTVLSDLTGTRRGQVLSIIARSASASGGSGPIVIRSRAPLSTLADYSEFLRTATSGRGNFSMQLHSYRAVSEADRHLLQQRV